MKKLLRIVVLFCLATPALAAPANADQLLGQLQQALGSSDKQQALGQGIAMASLMGCTSKTAGKTATDAFYRRMQAVGNQVQAQCDANRADEARTLVLATLKQNQFDRTVQAASRCYQNGKANFDVLAGPQLAGDAEHYARWVADPALAESEMTPQDVCR